MITIYSEPKYLHIDEVSAEEWIDCRKQFTCKVGDFQFYIHKYYQQVKDHAVIFYGSSYYVTLEGRRKIEKKIADYEAKKVQTIPLDDDTRMQMAAVMLFKGTPEQQIEALTYLGCSKAFIEFFKASEIRHEFSRANAGSTVQSRE